SPAASISSRATTCLPSITCLARTCAPLRNTWKASNDAGNAYGRTLACLAQCASPAAGGTGAIAACLGTPQRLARAYRRQQQPRRLALLRHRHAFFPARRRVGAVDAHPIGRA